MTNIEEARKAYHDLVTTQNGQRVYQRILKCLPKHKLARYEKIRTPLIVRLQNANREWNRTSNKLTDKEIISLFVEVAM